MHIGIVIWSLCHSRGGIQKVGVDLAHAMLARGHDITIFYRHEPDASPLYPISPHIKLSALNINNYAVPTPELAQGLAAAKTAISTSGINVLTALFSWNALLLFPSLLRGTGIPFLISEHNNPDIINNERWNAYERHACLNAADHIHTLSEKYVRKFPDFLHERITTIPNPVILKSQLTTIKATSNRKILLAAGRFVETHKQFSYVIKAFSELASQFPEWDLVLCGSGEYEKTYRQLVENLKLKNRITMPGMVSDISLYYSRSHIVCIPSRFEGFPLIPLEAHSHALPVVGFAECSGVNEIIVHDENGLLAKDMNVECLTRCLAKLMQDSDLRERLGARGKEMLSRYEATSVYDRWEKMLKETSRHQGCTQLQKLDTTRPDEEQCRMALYEILHRPSPFARCDFQTTVELKNKVRKLKNWQQKIRKAWYYRIGFWFYKKYRIAGELLKSITS